MGDLINRQTPQHKRDQLFLEKLCDLADAFREGCGGGGGGTGAGGGPYTVQYNGDGTATVTDTASTESFTINVSPLIASSMTNANSGLFLPNLTAPPSPPVGGSLVYSLGGEVFVMDSGGSITQLT